MENGDSPKEGTRREKGEAGKGAKHPEGEGAVIPSRLSSVDDVWIDYISHSFRMEQLKSLAYQIGVANETDSSIGGSVEDRKHNVKLVRARLKRIGSLEKSYSFFIIRNQQNDSF